MWCFYKIRVNHCRGVERRLSWTFHRNVKCSEYVYVLECKKSQHEHRLLARCKNVRRLCGEISSGSSKQELAGMLTLMARGHIWGISPRDTTYVRDAFALWFKGHIQA